MSAYAMTLTAALVLGSVPREAAGKVNRAPGQCFIIKSAEILDTLYGVRGLKRELDLRGEWEGIWIDAADNRYEASVENACIFGEDRTRLISLNIRDFADEKNGRFLLTPNGEGRLLGIYKQREGWIMLCFGEDQKPRPKVYCGDNGQHLIILYRVKPRK